MLFTSSDDAQAAARIGYDIATHGIAVITGKVGGMQIGESVVPPARARSAGMLAGSAWYETVTRPWRAWRRVGSIENAGPSGAT